VPALLLGLAFLNQALFWWGLKEWFEAGEFPLLQAAYLGAWDSALLLWFAWGQWRQRPFHRWAWLAVFWSGQLAWLGLGLWSFAGPLAGLPLAVGAAPSWLLGSLAWALWVEHLDHGSHAAPPLPDSSPYTDVLKALGGEGKKRK
jgi:hypothetical protein